MLAMTNGQMRLVDKGENAYQLWLPTVPCWEWVADRCLSGWA